MLNLLSTLSTDLTLVRNIMVKKAKRKWRIM